MWSYAGCFGLGTTRNLKPERPRWRIDPRADPTRADEGAGWGGPDSEADTPEAHRVVLEGRAQVIVAAGPAASGLAVASPDVRQLTIRSPGLVRDPVTRFKEAGRHLNQSGVRRRD